MSSTVEQIKEKLDAVEVIGSYVKLEKAGSSFKAKCPFHNERTPSFFVSPSRGTYYCFGCGAKGDIFTFVQEFERTDFPGALRLLGERAGVPIEWERREERGERERLHQALEAAARFFEEKLTERREAKDYLASRGVREATVRSWRLGWAPNEWRELKEHLGGVRGFSEAELVSAGLIKKGEAAATSYDLFRGRIIFPIFDSAGRVIGFSGRTLLEREGVPKYLNTPDTAVFHKGETLYGLHRAKSAIRLKDYAILVEGQMDLLACHQAGFENAVATSGTAFTETHVRRLQRISNKMITGYDADSAGFTAAKRSAELALSLGMEVKIAALPRGSDPAELIQTNESLWKKCLKSSKHLIEFYLDHLLETVTDSRRLGREIEAKILPYVALLPSSVEQSHFVALISKKAGIREEALWNDLKRVPAPQLSGTYNAGGTTILGQEEEKRKTPVERRIIGIVFWQEGLAEPVVDTHEIRTALVGLAGEPHVKELFSALLPEKDTLIFEAEAYYENEIKLKREVDELFIHFEEDLLREQFVRAMNELERAEGAKNENQARELLSRCQSISVRLAELSKKKLNETAEVH
ncbi:DNA primase [Patescibacteria group bacterium]|nr:MAG: DNA primase [Patescibacteria group bacterium]